MNKKAIAILGAIFILIVGTLGYLIYSKSSMPVPTPTPAPAPAPAPEPTPTPTPDPSDNGGNSSTTQTSAAITKLGTGQIISPALFYNGKGLSYFNNQGSFFQASFPEDASEPFALVQKRQLDIAVKSNMSKVFWPLLGNDFIVQFSTPTSTAAYSYFNAKLGTYTDLAPQVSSFDWMPSGDKIMYTWLEGGKSSLNISDPDTNNWKFLGDMWETDDAISVSPDGATVLYYEVSPAGASNAINSVSSDGKIWKGLVKNGFNMGVLWSPDSQKFLFGKKDLSSQKYQLWVYNLVTGEVKNLGLFTTPDKAVWDKDSNVIYAAVPDNGSAGFSSLTVDSFFRMDTGTLTNKPYPASSESIDGRNLFLSSTGDKLFFVNAQNGELYYLDLTK